MTVALYRGAVCLMLMVACASIDATGADTCLKIGISQNPTAFTDTLKKKIKTAYEQAGLCVEWIELLPLRAKRLLEEGAIDGDLMRTESFKPEPNDPFFFLDTPVFETRPALLTRENTEYDCRKETLHGLRVGYPLGTVWVEKNLTQYGPDLLPLTSIQDVKELIMRHRIDAFVYDQETVSVIKRAINHAGQPTRLCLWEPINIYHVMHKRHLGMKETLERLLSAKQMQP